MQAQTLTPNIRFPSIFTNYVSQAQLLSFSEGMPLEQVEQLGGLQIYSEVILHKN